MLWGNLLNVFGTFERAQTNNIVHAIPNESLTYAQVYQFALDNLPDPNITMRYSDYSPFGVVSVPEMTRAEYFARSVAVAIYSTDDFERVADLSGLLLSSGNEEEDEDKWIVLRSAEDEEDEDKWVLRAIPLADLYVEEAKQEFIGAIKRHQLSAKVSMHRLELILHKWENDCDDYDCELCQTEDPLEMAPNHIVMGRGCHTAQSLFSYPYQVPPYIPA